MTAGIEAASAVSEEPAAGPSGRHTWTLLIIERRALGQRRSSDPPGKRSLASARAAVKKFSRG